jgi:hypothetical protein
MSAIGHWDARRQAVVKKGLTKRVRGIKIRDAPQRAETRRSEQTGEQNREDPPAQAMKRRRNS